MIDANDRTVNGVKGTLLGDSKYMMVQHFIWNKNNASQDMVMTPIFTKINDETDAIKHLNQNMDGLKKLNEQYTDIIKEM